MPTVAGRQPVARQQRNRTQNRRTSPGRKSGMPGRRLSGDMAQVRTGPGGWLMGHSAWLRGHLSSLPSWRVNEICIFWGADTQPWRSSSSVFGTASAGTSTSGPVGFVWAKVGCPHCRAAAAPAVPTSLPQTNRPPPHAAAKTAMPLREPERRADELAADR